MTSIQMKRCLFCAKTLDDGAVVCPHCQRPRKAQAPLPGVHTPAAPTSTFQPRTIGAADPGRWKLTLAFAGLTLVAGVAWSLFTGGSAKKEAAPKSDRQTKRLATWTFGPEPSPTPWPRGIDDAPHYVRIPAGSFLMGCVPTDEECQSTETPRHPVKVREFWLSAASITTSEFDRFVDATGLKILPAYQHKRLPGEGYPILQASWEDARAYCAWAGGRLPTEAEWEYAARGGVEGERFPWGDDISHALLNYDGAGGRDMWYGESPVGSFPPNEFGIFDAVGNAAHWVEDAWHDSYEGAPDDGSARKAEPPEPAPPPAPMIVSADPFVRSPNAAYYEREKKRLMRVYRGGHYYRKEAAQRLSVRGGRSPDDRDSSVGIRCARDHSP